tara:strand:+ start:162 stop:686 length:525 start_codon:yes stop_codon:yes gene_type:complete
MCCFCKNTISLLSYNIYHDVKIAKTSNSYNIIEEWDKRKDKFPNKASSAKKNIMYKNTINLISSGKFYLSNTPNEISPFEDCKAIRYLPVTWAKFKKFDVTFFVFNFHLNAWKENSKLRIKYAKLILNKIKEITNNMEIPVILASDFNSNMKRDSGLFRIILKLFKTDRRLFDN